MNNIETSAGQTSPEVPCSADICGEPFTACACNTVKYMPEEVGCGLMRERWLCVVCKREFVKKPNDGLQRATTR